MQYYAQDSTDLNELKARVVAAENRKKDHGGHSSALFSLCIGLPIAAVVLVWVSVHGSFPYIRRHFNDPENFPSLAAFYWIGQTFSVFFIIVDIIALVENSKVDSLKAYQIAFIILVVVIEMLGISLSIVVAFVALFSQKKKKIYKDAFEFFFKCYKIIIGCGLLFKDIGRKEARAWLFTSSIIVPIIGLTSHAGFIVAGWVSYVDRSIAVILLYIFIFVFLYWCLYYIYRFSTVIVHHTLRKRYKKDKEKNKSDLEKSTNHFEDDLHVNSQVRKFIGFDTLALFFMLFLIIFVYGIFIYFLVSVLGFLLSSIDEALIHIFKIGNEGFVVIVFILTYKVFSISSGGGVNRLISNDAVRFWRFLNRRGQRDDPIEALQRAVKQLHQTLKAFSDKDKHKYENSNAEKGFCLKEVDEYLKKASNLLTTKNQDKKKRSNLCCWPSTSQESPLAENMESENRQSTPSNSTSAESVLAELGNMQSTPSIYNLSGAVGELKNVVKCDIDTVATAVGSIENWITKNNVTFDEQTEKDAALRFCNAINHLRKTLVKFLVPSMSVSSDKANALLAALVYQNMNTLQLEQSTPPQANPAPQQQQDNPAPQQQQANPAPQQQQQDQRPEETELQRRRYRLLLSLIEEDF